MSNYEVKPVVCDYGLYENNELKLIINNHSNAKLIKVIMEKDSKYGDGFTKNPKFTLEDFKKVVKA